MLSRGFLIIIYGTSFKELSVKILVVLSLCYIIFIMYLKSWRPLKKKFLFLIDIDEFEENLNGEDNIVYSDWKELVG